MLTFVNVAFALVCVIGVSVLDRFDGQCGSNGCGARENVHIELVVPIVLIFVLEVDDVLRLRKAIRVEDPDNVDGAHVLRFAHKCDRFALVCRVCVCSHLNLHLAVTFFILFNHSFIKLFKRKIKRKEEKMKW